MVLLYVSNRASANGVKVKLPIVFGKLQLFLLPDFKPKIERKRRTRLISSNPQSTCKNREASSGVCADGAGVKFSICSANCSHLPLCKVDWEENKEKRRKAKKKKEKAKKKERKQSSPSSTTTPLRTPQKKSFQLVLIYPSAVLPLEDVANYVYDQATGAKWWFVLTADKLRRMQQILAWSCCMAHAAVETALTMPRRDQRVKHC